MARAYDFSGKTAPVRIYRAYDVENGKWVYSDAPLYNISRASCKYAKRTFEVRMLEVDRTLNKDSLIAFLTSPGEFWKNEWIVHEYRWDSAAQTTRGFDFDGAYKKLVPTEEQKREEKHHRKREEAREQQRRSEERAKSSHRAYTEDPYFHTEEDYAEWVKEEIRRATGQSSNPTQNDFEKELNITAPYTLAQLKAAYWTRSKVTHPNAGGTNEAFLKTSNAFEGIKTLKGWK